MTILQTRPTVCGARLPAGTDPEGGTARARKMAGHSRRHGTCHHARGMYLRRMKVLYFVFSNHIKLKSNILIIIN